MTGLDQIMSG